MVDACLVVQDYAENTERCERLVVEPLLELGLPVYCHGAAHPKLLPGGSCLRRRDYRYDENVIKFRDCVRWLVDERPRHDVYWFVEHDCYVHDLVGLQQILRQVHDDFPCAWGNPFEFSDDWMRQLPGIERGVYFIGACFILNRRALEALAAFMEEYASRLSSWGQSCDFLLASCLQRDDIAMVSLNQRVHCAFPGMYTRFDLWSRDVAIFHKIEPHRAAVIDLYRRLDELPVNDLGGGDVFLDGLEFDSVSSYSRCGRNGRLYADQDITMSVGEGIDCSHGIGVHAPSHLACRVRREGYVRFDVRLALNHTAQQSVDFYLGLNGRTQQRVRIDPGQTVQTEEILPPGVNVLLVESVPTEHHAHNAHACLVNPRLAPATRDDYLDAEFRHRRALHLWR